MNGFVVRVPLNADRYRGLAASMPAQGYCLNHGIGVVVWPTVLVFTSPCGESSTSVEVVLMEAKSFIDKNIAAGRLVPQCVGSPQVFRCQAQAAKA